MLQHTLDRAQNLVPEDKIVTVIGRGHQRFLDCSKKTIVPGKLMEQPENLDTAPGLLLPLNYVAARDPEATVVVFPSDHFIFPEARFLSRIEQAMAAAERLTDRIILMGAQAEEPENDYGWVEPGEPWPIIENPRLQTRRIVSFCEKPTSEQANRFYLKGYLWNTMIMVGRVQIFKDLAVSLIPDLAAEFEPYRELVRQSAGNGHLADQEREVLQKIYSRLRPANFSREILQHAPDKTLVMPMPDIDWNDWGRPCRISESLARLQKCPSFPVEILAYA
jgi:mannose-1-phosphate guanylyltransferase